MGNNKFTRSFVCGHCKHKVTVNMDMNDTTFICPNCGNECHVQSINSKFTRFFILINISSLTILNDNTFRFVPAPPTGKFDHIYTDEELYKKFNLPQKYIDVIEAIIKERK